MTSEERGGLLYAALAAAFFSTSPVFITWADPMPSIVKTVVRLAVAATVIWALSRLVPAQGGDRTHPPPAQHLSPVRFAAYGLVTALHFLFYVASLDYTSAAHALAIVYTAPMFVTILSATMLKEPVSRQKWLGVAVTVVGIAVLAGLEPTMTPRMAFGDFLALLSAITYALYSLAARYERDRYTLFAYTWRVYGIGALWLAPAAFFTAISAPAASWGWQQIAATLALGIGPHAAGHTLYMAALRRTHATIINIIASQEVTGGIVLAFFLLGQTPSLNALVGAGIALVGIALVLK